MTDLTTTDPVQVALGDLARATEALGKRAGAHLEAAQEAAYSGGTTGVDVHSHALDAWNDWFAAVLRFERAQHSPRPKDDTPAWEWARLDELVTGDRIQAHNRSPVIDRWMTVGSISRPYDTLGEWRIYCAEKHGPYVVGPANVTVRKALRPADVPTTRAVPPTRSEVDDARSRERDEQLERAGDAA